MKTIRYAVVYHDGIDRDITYVTINRDRAVGFFREAAILDELAKDPRNIRSNISIQAIWHNGAKVNFEDDHRPMLTRLGEKIRAKSQTSR